MLLLLNGGGEIPAMIGNLETDICTRRASKCSSEGGGKCGTGLEEVVVV